MWQPSNLVIPEKVCLIGDKDRYKIESKYIIVRVSAKTDDPPMKTLMIKSNKPISGARITGILQSNSAYYANCLLDNLLPFAGSEAAATDVKYWALNDMVMEGLIGKNGVINSDLVFVTYSGHHSVIATEGQIYKKLVK